MNRTVAARVVWLDGLVENLDRTAANPNLLVAEGRLWLIDHGAALAFHYAWPALTEAKPRRPLAPRAPHALAARAAPLATVDERAAAALTREVLAAAVAAVPDSLLGPDPARDRAAYAAYLWKRLRAPRPFVEAPR